MPSKHRKSIDLGTPVRSTSRRELVSLLEQEVATGRLAPGERLDERVLAERFAVSRAAIRDAIGRLALQGMIVVKPRSGSYVAELGTSDVLELLEVMSGLEGMCANWAAQRLETHEQKELRRCAEACVQAAERGVDEYVTANRAFHDCIYSGTRNANLERLAKQVRQRVNAYRGFTFRLPGRLKQSAIEHLQIAEAICAGNADLAQRLTTSHTDIKKSDFARFVGMLEEGMQATSIKEVDQGIGFKGARA